MNTLDLSGLIPILGGIYGFLMAIGTLPKHPKEPEKMEQWREKFGKPMKIVCPIIILFGILQLFRILE